MLVFVQQHRWSVSASPHVVKYLRPLECEERAVSPPPPRCPAPVPCDDCDAGPAPTEQLIIIIVMFVTPPPPIAVVSIPGLQCCQQAAKISKKKFKSLSLKGLNAGFWIS